MSEPPPTEVIRVHRRSRKRILLTNTIYLLVIGPFLLFLASLWNFVGVAMWIACLLFFFNTLFYLRSTWKVLRQPHDFICQLTPDRFTCQSPDATHAQSFDVAITDITQLIETEVEDKRPRRSFTTSNGTTHTLSNHFGNPAQSFFNDLKRLLPHIPVEQRK